MERNHDPQTLGALHHLIAVTTNFRDDFLTENTLQWRCVRSSQSHEREESHTRTNEQERPVTPAESPSIQQSNVQVEPVD